MDGWVSTSNQVFRLEKVITGLGALRDMIIDCVHMRRICVANMKLFNTPSMLKGTEYVAPQDCSSCSIILLCC